jgi:hypothetical protein
VFLWDPPMVLVCLDSALPEAVAHGCGPLFGINILNHGQKDLSSFFPFLGGALCQRRMAYGRAGALRLSRCS